MTLRSLYEQRVKTLLSIGSPDATNPVFKEVAGAVNLQAILDGRIEPNGCYIFRERNNAGSNTLMNAVSQLQTHYIGFVLVSRNVRGERGADSSDENEALCDALQAVLLGWEPSSNHSITEYAGGTLISFKNNLLIWRELYQTTSLIGSI